MNKSDNIKQWLWNMFSAGLPVDYDLEVLRKIFLINLMVLVGGFFLILFSVIEFILQDYFLCIVDLLFFFIVLWLFIYLRKTGNYNFVGLIGATLIGLFYFFYIAYGGMGNTAYLWSFTYPLITIFLLGTKKGTVFSLILLFMACVVFVFESKIAFFTSYDAYLKMRFIPAYLIVYLLAFIMEKTRRIVASRLEFSKSEIEKTVEKLEKEVFRHKAVTSALKESEKRYNRLTNNISETIWEIDIDTLQFSYVSPSSKSVSGFSDQEIKNSRLEQLFPPTSLKLIADALSEELTAEKSGVAKPRLLEIEHLHKNGSTFWAEISSRFVRDTEGHPYAIVGVTRDITERKQIAAALRDSEEKYRTILENMEEGYFEVDIAGNFTFYNRAMCKILGYEYENNSLKGMNNRQYMDMKNAKDVFLAFNHVYRTGESYKALDWELIRKDGTTCNVETSISILKDEKGKPIGFKGIAHDNTERKQNAEALIESEKRYRLLADNVSDNLWVFDLSTMRFSYVSPSVTNITGFTAEEATGFQLQDTLVPASLEVANRLLAEELIEADGHFDPERSRTMELEQYRNNGATVWTEVSTKFIYDNENRPISILGVTRDISERKRLQQQLHKAQKMESIGLLAGGVAHDLNNVLSGIVSYPELILMNLPEDSKLRKPLKTMMESGLQATAIVQDLLTMARGVAMANEPLNLNDLIREYLSSPECDMLKQHHPAITIKTGLDPSLLNIGGSLVHVRKMIMNVVSNAAEAIKESGNITISTANRYIDKPLQGYHEISQGEYAVLSVADDGHGISSEDLERIFEPFFTKKKLGRSGTGLGLAVVWNVMQDHKGYIDVTTGENGTIFELYFSITRDAVLKKDLPLSIDAYKGNGEKILVVDDVASQREISCKILNTLGYKATSVSSGEKAVEYLKNDTVDLVLLDMIMDPGINGHETYKQIIKIHPAQKAIIVSGFSETDEVKKTQSLGAGKYIKKPLTIEKIGVAVKEELEK